MPNTTSGCHFLDVLFVLDMPFPAERFARAAPVLNASPAMSPMLALQARGVVVRLTGMSLAEWTSTTLPPTCWS